MEEIKFKTCTRCGDSKTWDSYGVYRVTLVDGTVVERKYAQCKTCMNKTRYERRKSNPEAYERLKARARKRSKRNYEDKPHLSKARSKAFVKKHVQEGTFKNKWLKHKYGLTLQIYNQMREDQDYRCKICKKSEEDLDYLLNVDHCHKGGNVRGLLCVRCNTTLGNIEIVGLENFIKYLQEAS